MSPRPPAQSHFHDVAAINWLTRGNLELSKLRLIASILHFTYIKSGHQAVIKSPWSSSPSACVQCCWCLNHRRSEGSVASSLAQHDGAHYTESLVRTEDHCHQDTSLGSIYQVFNNYRAGPQHRKHFAL